VSTGTEQRDHLDPLVAALRERAAADAAALLADADADADATLSQARAEADELLAEARAKGDADARAVLAAERARAEREARAVLLAAQRAAHDDLRRAAREAVCGLRGDPAYPALVAALRERALAELGPDATVTELPRGGVAARSGSRRVEFSLGGLADDLVDRLGADVEELWAP
jgi:vacuolar-type H+-ATPase subunit E/Vma4